MGAPHLLKIGFKIDFVPAFAGSALFHSGGAQPFSQSKIGSSLKFGITHNFFSRFFINYGFSNRPTQFLDQQPPNRFIDKC